MIIIINNKDNQQMVFLVFTSDYRQHPGLSLKISGCWVNASRWDTEQLAVTDPGEGCPPLFSDQTEALRAEKNCFQAAPPPCLRLWMTAPPYPPPPI